MPRAFRVSLSTSRPKSRNVGALWRAVMVAVVLITLDRTRADALGSYGQRLPVSPNFDRLAKRVTDGMSQPRPDFLDTLASAYAAVGDFASAVRVQKRVLHLIEGTGDAEQIENARDHLAHFEAGRPLREPESGD